MKAFLTSVAVLALVLLGTRANAQTRALGAHELVLDDGSGHTLTITTSTMSSNQTFTFPAATTYTPGSVLFADGNGAINQNNGEFFWNNTNNRLGIGNAAPAYPLDVTGAINTSTGYFIGGNTVLADNGSLSLGVNTGLPGSGVHNVFLGDYAGQNNAGGHENTFTGEDAGQSNTTGAANTANGYQALDSNTTGGYNTASGYQALYSNTTGGNNTASGFDALQSNTTGNNNTASGFDALQFDTTGDDNTASGVNALYSNATGNDNTASGFYALAANTTGYDNTASGANALYSNTTGVGNTASGMNALQYNTTGYDNTASGIAALHSNTSGGDNTASGVNALQGNTAGSYNTASGVNALSSNTLGNENTATGYGALRSNTGNNNTASGFLSLASNTTGTDNTASGYGALQSNNTTGDHLTAVGYGAGVSVNGLTNATAIGNQATVTASNTIQLGNSSVTDVYTSGTIHAGKLVTGATLGNGGTPAAGAVYVDNVIRAWGNIPAGGTTAFGEFGISSYTHTNGTGVYNLTLATSLASTSDGAVIVHTRDIGTSGWAYFTGPNTINVQTFSDFGVTAADEAFFIQVVGR